MGRSVRCYRILGNKCVDQCAVIGYWDTSVLLVIKECNKNNLISLFIWICF